jgi:RNA polymerase sigma-70 factor, ECF subfamily
MHTLNEQELIALARCGERQAFEELIAPYLGRLRRHIRRLVASESDADDVLQDALVGAWLGLPLFQGRSTVYTWLYRISHNTALNFMKMARRREAHVISVVPFDDALERAEQAMYEPGDHDTPETILQAKQRLAALDKGLRALDAERRVAFLQSAYHGASYKQVAAKCGVPVGTVRSRIHRARAELGLLEHSAAPSVRSTRSTGHSPKAELNAQLR